MRCVDACSVREVNNGEGAYSTFNTTRRDAYVHIGECCSAVARLSVRVDCTIGRVYSSMGRPVEEIGTALGDVPRVFTLILHAVNPDVHALYAGYTLPLCLMSS